MFKIFGLIKLSNESMMDKINLEVSYNANEWTQIESDFIFIFVDILCEIFSNLYDKMNDFRLWKKSGPQLSWRMFTPLGITPMWMSIFQYQTGPGIKSPTDFSYQASISMSININL
jgi:hypothetical protein